MNRGASYCSLMVVGFFLLAATVFRPHLISDENRFLADFVNQNVLAILGVILAITLASAAQIHLALNETESRMKRPFLHKTRIGVHSSSYCLIWLFLASILLVLVKPYFIAWVEWQSFFNGAVLFSLFWMVLIMASLMRLVFAIKPHFDDP